MEKRVRNRIYFNKATSAGLFLIAATLIIIPSRMNQQVQSKMVFTVSSPKSIWRFKPDNISQSFPIIPGFNLPAQLAPDVPCCRGVLIGEVVVDERFKNSSLQIGMQLPAIGGFQSLTLEKQDIELLPNLYSSTGPIVVLSKNLLREKNLQLEIKIKSPRNGFAGFWKDVLKIGKIQDLNELRDHQLLHQRLLPLFESAIFLIFGILFFWVQKHVKGDHKVYREFSTCLYAWSVFYFFLSGVPREYSEKISSIWHFPLRVLAGATTFKLISTVADISFPEIDRITIKGALVGIAAFMILLLSNEATQVAAFCCVSILNVIPIVVLVKNQNTTIKRVFLFSSVITVTGYLIDSVNVLLESFNHNLHFPYLDRYTAPPFLFTSILFLAYHLVEEIKISYKRKATADIAEQVSHDIKSPLAALFVVAHDVVGITEENRNLLRTSIARIRNLSNELLNKKREESRSIVADFSKITSDLSMSTELVSALVERAILTKRAQFFDKNGVKIEFYPTSGYWVFANLFPPDFDRVLSNLIDNAVEAFRSYGKVEVFLEERSDEILISIRDDGEGIPLEILPQLGQRGATFGKEQGSGLGLFHAKKVLEIWGGRLTINSTLKVGTTIDLYLPKASAPKWFVEKISFSLNNIVVVVDDDPSIHQIWDQKFKLDYPSEKNVKLVHFYRPEELKIWFAERMGVVSDVIFLIDFEFTGHRQNGLELIEMLGIAQNSILVTSRWDSGTIRARCNKFGVRILPKLAAAFVEIEYVSRA